MRRHNDTNDTNANVNATQQTGDQSAPQGNAAQQNGGQQYNPQYNNSPSPFAGIGINTSANVIDSEALQSLIEGLTARANSPEEKRIIAITVVPVISANVAAPIIAMIARAANSSKYAVYPLIIESMLKMPLEARRSQQQGYHNAPEIIIDMPTIRVFDNTAVKVTTQAVMNSVNCEPEDVIMLSPFVVPTTMDIARPEKQTAIYYSAMMALSDMAGGNIGRVTHEALANERVEVQLNTAFTPAESYVNRVGQLVASDFRTRMTLVDTAGQRYDQTQVNVESAQFNLVEASGVVDFTIMESAGRTVPPHIAQMGQAPQPTPGFIPTVILTDVASVGTGANAIEDLSTHLLAFAACLPVTYQYGWTRLWEPMGGKPSPKTSIGHLGIEHDYLGRGPEFMKEVPIEAVPRIDAGVESAYTMAVKYTTQAVALGIDIEHGGRLEWNQSIFKEAAEHPAGKANSDIIAETERLAPGFAGMWRAANGGKENAPVMLPQVMQVHLGNFQGEDGKRHDIRGVAYLDSVALLSNDKEAIGRVTAALVPGACNDVTKTDRRNFLQEVTGCTFTGMATRVILSPLYTATFLAALEASGVRIVSNDLMTYGGNGQRAGMGLNFAGVATPGGLVVPTYNGGVAPGGMTNVGYTNQFWTRG